MLPDAAGDSAFGQELYGHICSCQISNSWIRTSDGGELTHKEDRSKGRQAETPTLSVLQRLVLGVVGAGVLGAGVWAAFSTANGAGAV